MLCRLCVNECSDFTDIFQKNEHEIDISYLINSYFTFNVSHDDEQSTIVCRCCLDNLRSFNLFRQSIENAQNKWEIILDLQEKHEENDYLNQDLEFDIDSYSEIKEDITDETEKKIQVTETNLDQNDETDGLTENAKSESRNTELKEKKSVKSQLSEKFDLLIAENSNLFCNECNEPMESFKVLKNHFKRIHGKTGFMICCKRKFFRAADLADHINLHLNPNYFKCRECDKCFSSRYSLDFHQRTCHAEEDKGLVFKCKYCSRKFLTCSVRDKHEEAHNSNDLKDTEEKKHFCMQCGKSFPNELKLKSHDFNVHKIVYNRMCHVCGKTVRGNKALERHQLQHSGINPKVQCNICGAELSTKGILKAHMIALHPEDSNATYKCSICGKNSPSQRALKYHVDYVHKCEPKHKCSFCDKSFKKIQALKEHITRHTGDRLYECPHCPKTFKVRSNMHHHRKIKHPKEFQENRGKRIKSK